MPRIETQLSDYVDQGDLIEPPNYRVVDVLQRKPAKLTELHELENKAQALAATFKRDYEALADVLRQILKTDLWRQAGYTTQRDYCWEQLGWSYEHCNNIMDGAAVSKASEMLSGRVSSSAATELARLPEGERETAIKMIAAIGEPLTADSIRAYRKANQDGNKPTEDEYRGQIDAGIEQRVLAMARKHSQPAAMLRRIADEMEE